MDETFWFVGITALAILMHLSNPSFLKACASAAAVFSLCAIFVWPMVKGHSISNIWPIAFIFLFVASFLVSAIIGIPFIIVRRKA